MIAAAARLVITWSRTKNPDDLLFCLHCTLFGAAAVMFDQSRLWDLSWWGWHLLRLAAYGVALWFLILTGLREQRELLFAGRKLKRFNNVLEERVSGRTQELAASNDELRRAQEELAQTAERLELALTSANVGLWDWNARTNEVYYSPTTKSQLGYPPDAPWSSFDDWESRLHPDDRAEAVQRVHDYFEHRIDDYISIFRLRCEDGSHRWILSQGTAQFDADDVPVRMIGVHVDVTERKQHEVMLQQLNEALAERTDELQDRTDELGRANQLLTQSNRELEEFAYVASHDLQEPLRKIQAFGDLLASQYRDDLGDEGRDYLDRMHRAAGRMQALISDLLALSRVVRKGSAFESVDLNAVARSVLDDLEARIDETGGCVDVGEMPVLEADPTQMRQLFQNLIGNGLKYRRPDVAPRVVVAAEPLNGRDMDASSPATRVWRISVDDNGVGFDPMYAEQIFQPFQRLHGRSEFEGTGMGLSICRKIVERHGGTLVAMGRPDDGAEFVVTIPEVQNTGNHEDVDEQQ